MAQRLGKPLLIEYHNRNGNEENLEMGNDVENEMTRFDEEDRLDEAADNGLGTGGEVTLDLYLLNNFSNDLSNDEDELQQGEAVSSEEWTPEEEPYDDVTPNENEDSVSQSSEYYDDAEVSEIRMENFSRVKIEEGFNTDQVDESKGSEMEGDEEKENGEENDREKDEKNVKRGEKEKHQKKKKKQEEEEDRDEENMMEMYKDGEKENFQVLITISFMKRSKSHRSSESV